MLEEIKKHRNNNRLGFYLSENHWNHYVNQILYDNLKVFYEGKEVGAFLYGNNKFYPDNIKELSYEQLYGVFFNEAYSLCRNIIKDCNPDTKISYYLYKLASRKFRSIKHVKIEPNSIDYIEAYHILCMSFAILSFDVNKSEAVNGLLNKLYMYNHSVSFCMQQHCFNVYCWTYCLYICCVLCDENKILGKDYNYCSVRAQLHDFVWYKKIEADLTEIMNIVFSPVINDKAYYIKMMFSSEYMNRMVDLMVTTQVGVSPFNV